jgi:hypothetical protein
VEAHNSYANLSRTGASEEDEFSSFETTKMQNILSMI